MIRISEVRAHTKQIMKGKRAAAGAIFLLMIVIMYLSAMVITDLLATQSWFIAIVSEFPAITELLVIVLVAPFWFGLYRMFLGLGRDEFPSLNTAFSGFQQAGRAIGLFFAKGFVTLFVTLLLTKVFTLFIDQKHNGQTMIDAIKNGQFSELVQPLIIVVCFQICLLLVMAWVSYRLILAERIAIDEPQRSIWYALKQSYAMMNGHVVKMALLDLRNQLFFLVIVGAWIVAMVMKIVDFLPTLQDIFAKTGFTVQDLTNQVQTQATQLDSESQAKVIQLISSLSGLFFVMLALMIAYAWVWSTVETARSIYYDRMRAREAIPTENESKTENEAQ